MPLCCSFKGCQGQAGETLQDTCMNRTKGILSLFCPQKHSFQCTLTFQTSSTLRAGMGTSQAQWAWGNTCFCLKRSTFCQKLLTLNHSQPPPSAPPLLWLSELLGTSCTGDALFQTIAKASFSPLTFRSASANTCVIFPKHTLTDCLFALPNSHCLNFPPS